MTRTRFSAPAMALLAASALPLAAQEIVELEEIIVTGGSDAAGQSSVTADAMATRHQGADLPGVLRSLPGVTTQGSHGEEAELTINIRGMQNFGRVAVSIDGMRQNFARSGHGANGSFSVDPEMLRDISVTRRPGAGAGAIGGAVAMRQVAASDLITDGATRGGEVRLRYGDLTARPTLHAAFASQLGDSADLTLAATSAKSAGYTAPDGSIVPSDKTTENRLATLGLDLQGGERLTFSLSRLDRGYVTGRATSTARGSRLRNGSLSVGFASPDLLGWSVEGKVYETGTKLTQTPLDPLTLAVNGPARSYDTTTTGLLLEGWRDAEIAGRSHALHLRLEGFRDVVATDDPAGASLTPSGRRDIWSLLAEDQIAFGDATLTVALGAERYRMDSSVGDASGTSPTARIAWEQPLTERLTLNASAALAFRPPSLAETLVDGLHPEPADFPVRPNPALKPERARNVELGLDYLTDGLLRADDSLHLNASVYRNDVRDYIGMDWVGGVFSGFFQYQNLAHVRIEGLELQAEYSANSYFVELAGQHMRGVNLVTGNPLTNAMPDRLTLTLGHRADENGREIGLRLTHSDATDSGATPLPGWKTVDLFLNQELTETASLGLTLNNIFDETYTPHLETQPAPGFNAQLSLTMRF